MTTSADAITEEIHLGVTSLKWVNEFEYLGSKLNNTGFLGKNPYDVEKSCKSAVHLLTGEDWFTFDIDNKYIFQEFSSMVRSQLTYGAEIISYE